MHFWFGLPERTSSRQWAAFPDPGQNLYSTGLNGTQQDALKVEMPVICFNKVLDSEQRARWQAPVPGEPGALSAIHIRAAQRIYGEAGHQVLCCSMLLIHALAPSSVLRFQLQHSCCACWTDLPAASRVRKVEQSSAHDRRGARG